MLQNYSIILNFNNRRSRLTDVKKTENTGLAQIVGYYCLKKGVKQKYARIVTGLKYDLELNIHDHDIDSDNNKLFFLEKPHEFYKRWDSKDISTVLKYVPENQFINYANFNHFTDIVNHGDSELLKKKNNYYLQHIYQFYFRGRVPYKCRRLDDIYGNFNPFFKKINTNPAWFGFFKKAEIRNWHLNQFFSQKLCSDLLYMENKSIITHPRFLPILFKVSNKKLIFQKYQSILVGLRQFMNFFDLLRLPIYLSWRHNRFFSRKKSIMSVLSKVSVASLAIRKKLMLSKASNFFLPYVIFDATNNRFKRLASPHELARALSNPKKYFSKGLSSYLSEPIFFKNGLNHRLFTSFLNFKNYLKFFLTKNKIYNYKKFSFYFVLQKNFINVINANVGSRFLSNFFTPYIQSITTNLLYKKRHKYRTKKFHFFKKDSFQKNLNLSKISIIKRLNFLTNLSNKISIFFTKILKFLFRIILLLNILHIRLANLVESNRYLYLNFVNNVISGLNNRFNFVQRFINQFVCFYSYYQLQINFTGRLNFLLMKFKPSYNFSSLLSKNVLSFKQNDNRLSLFKSVSSFVSLFPSLITPLLAKFAGHSLLIRTNYELVFENLNDYLYNINSTVYQQFLGYNGFRYYYAGQLNYLYFTSAFQKSINLSFSGILSNSFVSYLPFNKIFNNLIKKGLSLLKYKLSLSNFFVYKSKFFKLKARRTISSLLLKKFKRKFKYNKKKLTFTKIKR